MNNQPEGGEKSPPKNYDHTSTRRTQRRRAALKKLAQAHGFETMDKLLTAWLNGTIRVSISNDET